MFRHRWTVKSLVFDDITDVSRSFDLSPPGYLKELREFVLCRQNVIRDVWHFWIDSRVTILLFSFYNFQEDCKLYIFNLLQVKCDCINKIFRSCHLFFFHFVRTQLYFYCWKLANCLSLCWTNCNDVLRQWRFCISTKLHDIRTQTTVLISRLEIMTRLRIVFDSERLS